MLYLDVYIGPGRLLISFWVVGIVDSVAGDFWGVTSAVWPSELATHPLFSFYWS